MQQHQLRVAAVAELICDALEFPIDATTVIQACLVHDMGNIIKAKFSHFPRFLEPEGEVYWQKVKDDFIKKYGDDHSEASVKIASDLGLNNNVIDLLSSFGYLRVKEIAEDAILERKICCYSDIRVGPKGVISVDERVADSAKRYSDKRDKVHTGEFFEEISDKLHFIENGLMSLSNHRPNQINDQSIEPLILKLKKFSL